MDQLQITRYGHVETILEDGMCTMSAGEMRAEGGIEEGKRRRGEEGSGHQLYHS